MSILPDLSLASTRFIKPSARSSVEELDAVIAIAAADASADHFSRLPHAGVWKKLHTRTPAQPGTTRSSGLSGDALAVLGYVERGASRHAQLTIAGKLLADVAACKPKRLGIAVVGFDRDAGVLVEALLAAAYAHAFALAEFRSKKSERAALERIDILSDAAIDLERIQAAARGNNLARWLTALPPSELDAVAYRRALTRLARDRSITMRWLDEGALRKLGAGAFLAVAAGNPDRNAGIAHLSYRPAKRAAQLSTMRGARARARNRGPDVALIGKGILFDTGGINVKPHRSMLDMHTDMAGSAVAVATLFALAELRAPISADAWLPITENCIGPRAYRPQDIVRAANGTTIQIVHTDAEGRLVLADTLALAATKAPKLMLDFATLTGACEYALTERMSGVFTNRPALVDVLLRAGATSGERVWNFPMDPDYDADIESRIADVAQCAVESKGDHIHAARFLSRFVPDDIAWAHYDLSSAVRRGGLAHVPTEVTGFGVRYALELLLEHRVLEQRALGRQERAA